MREKQDILDIALELVPRTLDGLVEEAHSAMKYERVVKINIPEIRSMDIKSFEATEHLLQNGVATIPHFRTIDHDQHTMEGYLKRLVDLGLQEVLFITGDPPEEQDFVSSGETPVSMVRALKPKFPELIFYAGTDPYRSSMKTELAYCREKLDAGFDGFFTQPFFSPELLELYLEQLEGVRIYVGISPVTTQSSRKYWENVNQVVFPKSFEVGLEYNAPLGHRLLEKAAEFNQPSYLMPITISSAKYLSSMFTR